MSEEIKTRRAVKHAKRLVGMPGREHFSFVDEPVPALAEGQVLVQVTYLSVDPYQSSLMKDLEGKGHYMEGYALGGPITNSGAGVVAASRHAGFAKGDVVTGYFEWASAVAVEPEKTNLMKVPHGVPVEVMLSALGMTGLTAYFGLLRVGALKDGERVVVSGASGAVGMVVGQIAKLKGCTVVGIAGTDEKCGYLKELGFDATINYKTDNVAKKLREALPEGFDVYFDNVGGRVTDAVLPQIRRRGRVSCCGAISMYTATEVPSAVPVQGSLIVRSARMEGFIITDFAADFKGAMEDLAKWFREGKIKHRVTVKEGLDNIPEAFAALFKGENIGKMLCKL